MGMKINIFMLLGIRYDPKMRIVPQIGIASYITNFGHDVTWVLSSEELDVIKHVCFNGVNIFVVPCRYRDFFLKTVTKVLYALRRAFFIFKSFKYEEYNMIFVRDSVFDGLLALSLKRIYKVSFVFEMSNPIEQNYEKYQFYSNKYFWYLIKRCEAGLISYLLHKADLVLPTTKWMLDDFAEKGITKSKMIPFPNGIELGRFSNTDGNLIKSRYNLKDSKVIIYIGTMDKLRHLNSLIHSFSKVVANKKNVTFLMVGDGSDKINLERLTNDLGLKNKVIFTGQVSPYDIPNFIDASDIGVSPIPPLSFYKLSSPIKLFEYMAMSKPVVANEEIPEQKEVLQESGGGILVQFNDSSFANAIIDLLDDPERAKEMGKKGRDWVLKNRNYEILARRLEDKYLEILSK
jgi:glycosyltransferase involved in cell wall biosynthesis